MKEIESSSEVYRSYVRYDNCFGCFITLAMLAATLFSLIIAWGAFENDGLSGKLISSGTFLMFAVASILMSNSIIEGEEWEFVIEDGIARWGKVGKKQKGIVLSEVVRINLYNDSDYSDEFVLKDKSIIKFPHYHESKESGSFTEFLKKTYPEIKVVKKQT